MSASLEQVSTSENDAIVAARLIGELFALNERHALLPRASFHSTAVDALNDQQLLGFFNRWRARDSHQWTVLNHPYLLSSAVKQRLLKIESALSMQSSVSQSIAQSIFQRGELKIDALRCEVTVRRSHLLEDALTQLRLAAVEDRLKRPLYVRFEGEPGIDEGGLRKEFFQLTLRELFNEVYGMFKLLPTTNCFWPRSDSFESTQMFELTGILIGLGLYNNVLVRSLHYHFHSFFTDDRVQLECHFPLAFWKKLLRKPVDLLDLESVAPDVARNLSTLLTYEGDVESDFDLTFTVAEQRLGQTVQHALLANGADVAVTARNRDRFVELYADWLLNGSIAEPFEALRSGFERVAGCVSNLFCWRMFSLNVNYC